MQRATRDTIRINQEKMAQNEMLVGQMQNNTEFEDEFGKFFDGTYSSENKGNATVRNPNSYAGVALKYGLGYTWNQNGEVVDKEGKVLSDAEATQRVVSYQRGTKARDLIYASSDSEAIQDLLGSQGYDEQII
jgi:hypothetical protein